MLCLVKLLIFVTVCAARELSDEELHRLPKLFHLDDYDRCLSQKDGVYCVGTFQLDPTSKPNKAYDIITEQLKQHFSFDRRLLHRGYCLSKRCQSSEQNVTLRFEQCADRLVRRHALSARLNKLAYCTTHAERKAKLSEAPDLPQRVFLYVVYLILLLNVLGTIHDVYGDGKKNKHLVVWSIPANWRALTTIDDGASTFAAVQGTKIILHCIIIYTHANLLHFMGYMDNPEGLEKSRDSFVNVLIRNGTSLVQVFILISSFFTGYNVLETAKRSTFGTGLAAKWILKRIFRLAPVYLLLTAYSATWWPRMGDGPLWAPIVGAESQVCRNKFWTHVFFINNFIDPSALCMVQSWAMAAEVQLFLVSLLLTLLLMKLKVRAVPLLAAMFVASCLFNVALAYAAGLVPMVKIIVPETLRNEFRGSRSFFHLHTSPWSNLPACFFGLLIAHVYFEQKNKVKSKAEDRKDTNGGVQNELKPNNDTIFKTNGALVNGNGTPINENGKLVNGNGTLVNGNSTPINEDGKLVNGNGTLVNGNSTPRNENGKLVNGNGALVNGNSVPRNENCKLVNGNGALVNGNSTPINENGKLVNGNGTLVNGNSTPINENGKLVNGNGALVNGDRRIVTENGVCVNNNDVHIINNGVCAENVIRYRSVTANVKSNGAPIDHTNCEQNNNNRDMNEVINQNGQSKSNGCEKQNGLGLRNKDQRHKKRPPFLLRYAHCFTLPVLVVWLVLGARVATVDSAPVVALYVGLERVMFSLTFACQLLQVVTIKGPWAKLLSWRGWTVPARLVLSVAMVHWCVNATILAAKPQPVTSSILYVSIDCLATLFYSYLIALPMCVLVELPMKRALDALIA